MDFKDKFSFFSPEFIEQNVQGQILKFYPICVRTSFRIRSVAQPIARALTVLMTRHDTDTAQHSKANKDGVIQDVKMDAISADLAAARTSEREGAVGRAIGALLDPDNAAVLGIMLADSLRDDLPRNIATVDAKKFVDEMPLPALTEMLTGLARANKKVFGPLLKKAEGLVKQGLAAAAINIPESLEKTGGESSKTE